MAGSRCAWPNVAPKEHEQQHCRISPGGTQTNRPCQHGRDHREFHVFTIRSRGGHFAHRTTQRALEHGLQEPGHRSTLWHPACCGSRRATLATRSRACNTNPAQRRGAPASRHVSTVKPFEMSTRLRARGNCVLFRYWSWECGRAYRFFGVADVRSLQLASTTPPFNATRWGCWTKTVQCPGLEGSAHVLRFCPKPWRNRRR